MTARYEDKRLLKVFCMSRSAMQNFGEDSVHLRRSFGPESMSLAYISAGLTAIL